MKKQYIVWMALVCGTLFWAEAEDARYPDFREQFAYGGERRAALASEYMPGTQESYQYQTLDAQNRGALDAADKLLAAWKAKYPDESAEYKSMRFRQMLLTYPATAPETLKYLIFEYGVQLNHPRPDAPVATYPSELNPDLVSERHFLDRAVQNNNAGMVKTKGFALLAKRGDLSLQMENEILRRIPEMGTADADGVFELLLRNQKRKGDKADVKPILPFLTTAQLDKFRAELPLFAGESAFVNAYLRTLQPSREIDIEADPAARRAYLERTLAFARTLPPPQKTVLARALYAVLDDDRQAGRYDAALFKEYIALPVNHGRMNPDYLKKAEIRELSAADWNASFSEVSSMLLARNDEPLVTDYLEHLLEDADTPDAFAEWLEHGYLERKFILAKLLAGKGNAAELGGKLSPMEYQTLKDRVEVTWLPTNPKLVAADAAVALDVRVKNVKDLRVSIYDIDAAAVCRSLKKGISDTLALDGCAPTATRVIDCSDQPPLRRKLVHLAFDEVKQPGVYMIECAGNGVCTRAILRKGRLSASSRVSAAGVAVAVRGEDGSVCKDATLWLDGQFYKAGENGEIIVPFSSAKGSSEKTAVVASGRLAAPFTFQHLNESYTLGLGLLIDRENLLPGEEAEAILHTWLTGPEGKRVSIALLEHPALEVSLADYDGVATVSRVTDLKLSDTDALVYRFKVPARSCNVGFRLTGDVRVPSQGRTDTLDAAAGTSFASQGRSDSIADAYLRKTAEGYLVELRGRTGEPLANKPARFQFYPRLFSQQENVTLQSDANGIIRLGTLKGIEAVRCESGGERQWMMQGDDVSSPPEAMNAAEGTAFRLPALEADAADARRSIALLARNASGAFTEDMLSHATVSNGTIVVSGLAPGDYLLKYRELDAQVALRVTAPKGMDSEMLVGANRVLEKGGTDVLRVDAMASANGKLNLHILGATEDTRVHLFARRMAMEIDLPHFFGQQDPEEWSRPAALNVYLASRQLGDEERYVMDRRAAGGRIGNSLPRPTALVTPWSREETATRELALKPQGAFQSDEKQAKISKRDAESEMLGERSEGGLVQSGEPVLEFLPEPAAVAANLKPDADGNVSVPDAFGGRQEIYAIAVDGERVAFRRIAGKAGTFKAKDLRLAESLPDAKAFTQSVVQTGLAADGTLTLAHGNDVTWRAYTTLESVRKLFQAAAENATLNEFAFVTEWPSLTPERKRELYGKYACHELNFFLYNKDKAFFDTAIAPNLKNKRVKRFMDAWLLGEDVSAWRQPEAWAKLNALEKALLGRRLAAEGRADVAREFADICALQPRNPEADERTLNIALSNGEEPPPMAEAIGGAFDRAADKDGAVAFAEEETKAANGAVAGAGGRSTRFLATAMPAVAAAPAADTFHRAKALAKSASALGADAAKRREVRQMYRPPERTREWMETYYWKTAAAEERPDRVAVNRFWRDFAAAKDGEPFVSAFVMDAARGSFTERMAALAVLNVTFDGKQPETKTEDGKLAIHALAPALVFLRETNAATEAENAEGLAIVERFFNPADHVRQVNGENVELFEKEEFLTGFPYGSQIVVMNPSAEKRYVRVLRQIPQGAIALGGAQATQSEPMMLNPYETRKLDGALFYFPFAGEKPFPHYAARLTADGKVLARGVALAFNAVVKSGREDKASWQYVADKGSDNDVLAFLAKENVRAEGVNLNRIAWRMGDKAFFTATLAAIDKRGLFDSTLWGYAFKHDDPPRIRQFLEHNRAAERCGKALKSALLVLEPERDGVFEHREYWPLINTRTHAVGGGTFIANASLAGRYREFLDTLAYKPALSSDDQLLATVYLLMQDRVDEAAKHFAAVKRDEVSAKMQVDYASAWLAFAAGKPDEAVKTAEAYRDYSVPVWRDRFRDVLAQAAEITGGAAAVNDKDSREEAQHKLAIEAPMLTVTAENDGELHIVSRNVAACELRFHPVDMEMLFSKNPFMGNVSESGAFTSVRPAGTQNVELGGNADKRVTLPENFRKANLLVEAVGDGGATQALVLNTPNAFTAQLSQNYGRVSVTRRDGGKPFAGVYVKVYARGEGGQVRYHKDGYTDLRGLFDYASISTDSEFAPKTFALLLVSPDGGTSILTVPAPAK